MQVKKAVLVLNHETYWESDLTQTVILGQKQHYLQHSWEQYPVSITQDTYTYTLANNHTNLNTVFTPAVVGCD